MAPSEHEAPRTRIGARRFVTPRSSSPAFVAFPRLSASPRRQLFGGRPYARHVVVLLRLRQLELEERQRDRDEGLERLERGPLRHLPRLHESRAAVHRRAFERARLVANEVEEVALLIELLEIDENERVAHHRPRAPRPLRPAVVVDDAALLEAAVEPDPRQLDDVDRRQEIEIRVVAGLVLVEHRREADAGLRHVAGERRGAILLVAQHHRVQRRQRATARQAEPEGEARHGRRRRVGEREPDLWIRG